MEKLTELTNKLGTLGSLGLGLVLALLVAYAGYSYVIEPYGQDIEAKKKSTEEKEKSVAKLGVIEKERELVMERGAQIYADYLKGARLLPSGEQVSEVLEAIEGKAGQNGSQVISFDAFKLGGPSNVGSAVPVPINQPAATGQPTTTNQSAVYERVVEGELSGGHSELVGFLRAISYYDRITEIRAISAQKDERGIERLKFVLAAYYLPTKITVPDAMRDRALEILKQQGFDPNDSTKFEKNKPETLNTAATPDKKPQPPETAKN